VHGPRPGINGPPEEIASTLGPDERVEHDLVQGPNIGISWKIWREDIENKRPIQLEWTWVPDSERTWYDLSMIDAAEAQKQDSSEEELEPGQLEFEMSAGAVGVKHAFAELGLTLTTERNANAVEHANCVDIKCEPGDEYWLKADNKSDDWERQHDCQEDVGLKLTLCS